MIGHAVAVALLATSGHNVIQLAPKLGVAVPTSELSSAPTWAVELALRPDAAALPITLPLPLTAALELSGATFVRDGRAVDRSIGTYAFRLEQRRLLLVADVIAQLPSAAVPVYVGLGYGLSFMRSRSSALGQTYTQQQTRGALSLRGGVEYPLEIAAIFVEGRARVSGDAFSNSGARRLTTIEALGGVRIDAPLP